MQEYHLLQQIGQGTFGHVFECFRESDKAHFAIKQPRSDGPGVSWFAIREIKLLSEMGHVNVIQLVDITVLKETLCMVLPLCLWNLDDVIVSTDQQISVADMKSYIHMMISALSYIHNLGIIHRDIKANNFLMAADRQLKLCDFGSARIFPEEILSIDNRASPQAVTTWYRPPELMFGSKVHNPAVDIWSCGCVIAELIVRKPLFQGRCDIDQLSKIFSVIGSPGPETWPDANDLPYYLQFEFPQPITLRSHIDSNMPQENTLLETHPLDMISRMLALDPKRRISAQSLLESPWFQEIPLATSSCDLLEPSSRANLHESNSESPF